MGMGRAFGALVTAINAWVAKQIARTPSGGGIVGQIIPNPTDDPDNPPFNITGGSFANSASSRDNFVVIMGHNIASGGGVDDATKPASFDSWEGYYEFSTGVFVFERHIGYIIPAGSQRRVITWYAKQDDSYIEGAFQADKWSWMDRTNVNQAMVWEATTSGGGLYATAGTVFLKNTNNQTFLQQLNAAGTGYINIAYINGSNEVQIGHNPADNTGKATIGSSGGIGTLKIFITSGSTILITQDSGIHGLVKTTVPNGAADSQAGSNLTVQASDAVAGQSNAGAAAGGNLVLEAGDAKRLTSGNANGGVILVTPGEGIGTGVAGYLAIRQPGGVAGTDDVRLSHNGTNAQIETMSGGTLFKSQASDGRGCVGINAVDAAYTLNVENLTNAAGVLRMGNSAMSYQWLCQQGSPNLLRLRNPGGNCALSIENFSDGIGLSNTDTSAKVGLQQAADAVWKATNGSSGSGWFQNTAGSSRVNGDIANATTTLAAITGLSFTSIAGRKYRGKIRLYVEEATAADGLKLDLDGGTGTWTSFRATYVVYDTTTPGPLASGSVTAIATDFTVSTLTGAAWVDIEFSGVANAAGTFIPRQAKNSDAAGANLTTRANSTMLVEDIP